MSRIVDEPEETVYTDHLTTWKHPRKDDEIYNQYIRDIINIILGAITDCSERLTVFLVSRLKDMQNCGLCGLH